MRARVSLLAMALGAATATADVVDVGGGPWQRTEMRASEFSRSAQAQAALAIDADGAMVVVWSSRRQQGGRYGVYGRRLTAAGPLGEETCLNLWTEGHQWLPAIDAGGPATWAAWASHGQDGDAGAIIARRFGTELTGGSEILVNDDRRGHQTAPVLAVADDGSVLIAWERGGHEGTAVQVSVRAIGPDGATGPARPVAEGATLRQRFPSVAWAASGTFAVVYAASDGQGTFEGSSRGIRLQCIGADGRPDGPLHVVTDDEAIEPVVAAAGDMFIVAWHAARPDGDGFDVHLRRLCPDGHRLDAPMIVNEAPAQSGAAVAAHTDGRAVVAWNAADSDGTGVFGRLIGADGRPGGPVFRVNRHEAGRQALHEARATRRLAYLPGGGIACAWDGAGGAGDDSAVHVTVLAPTGQMPGPPHAAAAAALALAPAPGPQPHRPPTHDPHLAGAGKRTVLRTGNDLGFTGIFSTGWVPPDPHMAVGPDHLVLMTNGVIGFFTKTGTMTFQDQIEGAFGFWGGLGAGTFVFDPEVVYDPTSERFFAMATEDSGAAFILLAVSDDSDPNGTWFKYRIDVSAVAGTNYDSPNMCVGEDVVYFTGDALDFGTNPLFTFDKAPLLVGDPAPAPVSLLIATSTQSLGIPPIAPDGPRMLVGVEHEESLSSQVRLVAVTDPLGSPVLAEALVTVPAYSPPEDPPQAGTTARLETFDARFWSVAYRDGSLWATHHVVGFRVRVRWYEIALNGWPAPGAAPALVQSGEVDPGPGVRTFFSAITVDAFGNAFLVYARSAPDEFLSMETAMRYRSDPPGTFRPGVQRKANTNPYTGTRWGDYGAIQADPVDPKRIWAHHEWAQAISWRTWVAAWTPVYATTDFNCDGTVDALDLLRLLAEWGSPCGGSCAADVTGPGGGPDGVVDALDLLRLLAEWG